MQEFSYILNILKIPSIIPITGASLAAARFGHSYIKNAQEMYQSSLILSFSLSLFLSPACSLAHMLSHTRALSAHTLSQHTHFTLLLHALRVIQS